MWGGGWKKGSYSRFDEWCERGRDRRDLKAMGIRWRRDKGRVKMSVSNPAAVRRDRQIMDSVS